MYTYLKVCAWVLGATLSAWAQFTSPTTLTEFSFKGARGDEALSAPDFERPHVLASAMQRSAGLQPSAAPGGFGATGWSKARTPDANKYFEFTLAPESGWALNLQSLVISEQSLESGAREWSVRSSLDGFAQDLAQASTGSESKSIALGSQFWGLKGAVTFRVFGYLALPDRPRILAGWPISITSPSSRSWFIDNLEVKGSVVPEPAAMAGAFGCGLLAYAWLRRRRN